MPIEFIDTSPKIIGLPRIYFTAQRITFNAFMVSVTGLKAGDKIKIGVETDRASDDYGQWYIVINDKDGKGDVVKEAHRRGGQKDLVLYCKAMFKLIQEKMGEEGIFQFRVVNERQDTKKPRTYKIFKEAKL